MDFTLSDRSRELRDRLAAFMDEYVYPAEAAYARSRATSLDPHHIPPIVEDLKVEARSRGLWNLFLPGVSGLSNVEYAPLAELMGRSPVLAAEACNCSAPDTGNMELLHMFANPEQNERWLLPLLRGEIRSCFAMTEPDVASSDATNIRTTIQCDGDDYVVKGRKWFVTGAQHPLCRLVIVLGVSNSGAAPHLRHSMILVPLETTGVEIVRNVPVFNHYAPEGHCEVLLNNVRVPRTNLLGEEGQGFALAQARLGPGRVHHCMRTIGQCELALDLMTLRALERRAFNQCLADFSNVQDWIAESRIEIDQARLLVLQAASKLDRLGNKAARVDVSAIKVIAPRLQTRVCDRAIQIFGAMGVTTDTPLADLFLWGRALRFVDGPDEVHLRVVAQQEFKRVQRDGELRDYLRTLSAP